MRPQIHLWALLPAFSVGFQNIQPRSCRSCSTRNRHPLFALDPTSVMPTPEVMGAMQPAADAVYSANNLPDPPSNLLVPVPPDFFTVTGFLIALATIVLRRYRRFTLRERAFEMRLEEARMKEMAADPSLTERDLRRAQGSIGFSPYGDRAKEEEEREKARRQAAKEERQKRRTMTLEEEEEYEREIAEEEEDQGSLYRMSDAEIEEFESTYGIDYDPYYDEPYFEDELPDDIKYQTDRTFGDRIYEDGEIFYQHGELYYRQGSIPRKVTERWGWPGIIQQYLDKQK